MKGGVANLDTCAPASKLVLYSFRIYSIVLPTLLFILLLETIYVFSAVPASKLESVSPFPSSAGRG
jgi:hypothetical protein